jgi:dTDP-4-amino-4,6-dideoxygalactose transaminase
MPMYSRHYRRLPEADGIACRGITLPSHPSLSDDEVTAIGDTVLAAL